MIASFLGRRNGERETLVFCYLVGIGWMVQKGALFCRCCH